MVSPLLDPVGARHIVIGEPDALDTVKTYVEAEGVFSPGFGSYGVYVWLHDRGSGRLYAPTMPDIHVRQGLHDGGAMVPWVSWTAGDVAVFTQLCSGRQPSPAGDVHVIGLRVALTGLSAAHVCLYIAVRPLGPAGWPIHAMTAVDDALLVDGHPAVIGARMPRWAGVLPTDSIGDEATRGEAPMAREASSETGDCSGALVYDLQIEASGSAILDFICPVLPGRRAVGHRWDGVSPWAQLDLNRPNPEEGGVSQPDPGLAWYRALHTPTLLTDITQVWRERTGRVALELPDPRWAEAFRAIAGHVAMAMNEGAPDVTPVNYNVFSRDGVYVADILLKTGAVDLARTAIDYFLAHPFNGRAYPEADNPGQVLWILAEYWRFTRDGAWLQRVYPAVPRLVALIDHVRTHGGAWVRLDDMAAYAEPGEDRQWLEPGKCDGHHPEYTEAFDIAGLRAAAELAEVIGDADAVAWRARAEGYLSDYTIRFGDDLGREYGSYCVQWPCRLYPLEDSPAQFRFRDVPPQEPTSWRYFPLATAHQALLSGNRETAFSTLEMHLDHPQMQGWYAFDEGGPSGPGNWPHVRTTWDPSVAMPHGWAIAEVHLLLRDCLAYEDGGRLVLLAGVPPDWFGQPMRVDGLPTHFGALTLTSTPTPTGAVVEVSGVNPPEGIDVRAPETVRCIVHWPSGAGLP